MRPLQLEIPRARLTLLLLPPLTRLTATCRIGPFREMARNHFWREQVGMAMPTGVEAAVRTTCSLVGWHAQHVDKDQAIFPALAGTVDHWSYQHPSSLYLSGHTVVHPTRGCCAAGHPQGIQPLAKQNACRGPSVSYLDDGVPASDTLLVSQGPQAIQQVARSVAATSSAACITNSLVAQRPAKFKN